MDWNDIIQEFASKAGFHPFEYQRLGTEMLLAGTDVMAIVPTGGGKSAVAQIVTGLRGKAGLGLTVAVEPIIALIDDQHRRAQELGLRAEKWNSKVSPKQKRQIIHDLENDALDILFTTPESISNEQLYGRLVGRVGLAWIDEGHYSISSKHFREYWAKVGEVVDLIKPQVRYACTATCSAASQRELLQRCGMREPFIIRCSADRPNLSYTHIDRTAYTLFELCCEHKGEKILVYVATRRECDRLTEWLKSKVVKAGFYHGGLDAKQRKAAQTGFGAGEFDVMLATDAFGLGVDYPDIRHLVTFDPADNISGWVQQAGRAGRDGKPAMVYLASRMGAEVGFKSRWFLVSSSFPPIGDIRAVWEFIKRRGMEGQTGNQHAISKQAGVTEQFMAPACFHWLKRKRLLRSERMRADKRKFIYFAFGQFEHADWTDYEEEKPAAMAAMRELQDLWNLPGKAIPKKICDYFAGEDGYMIDNVREPAKFSKPSPETKPKPVRPLREAQGHIARMYALQQDVRIRVTKLGVERAKVLAAEALKQGWNKHREKDPLFFMDFLAEAENEILGLPEFASHCAEADRLVAAGAVVTGPASSQTRRSEAAKASKTGFSWSDGSPVGSEA